MSVNKVALLTTTAGKSQASKSMVQQMEMSDDGEYLTHVVVLTTNEVLSCGLQVAGLSKKRIDTVKKNDPLLSTTNHQRFKNIFWVSDVSAV